MSNYHQKQPFLEYIEQGNRFSEQGDLAAAISSYRHAVELAPGDPLAHQTLAEALNQQGETTEAMYHYQQAIALSGQDKKPSFSLEDYSTGPKNHGEGGVDITADFYRTHQWDQQKYIFYIIIFAIPYLGMLFALYNAGMTFLAGILLGITILCLLLVSLAYWVDKNNF